MEETSEVITEAVQIWPSIVGMIVDWDGAPTRKVYIYRGHYSPLYGRVDVHIPMIYAHHRRCTLCRTEYRAGERMVVLPCRRNHRFHMDCLEMSHVVTGTLQCTDCRQRFVWWDSALMKLIWREL